MIGQDTSRLLEAEPTVKSDCCSDPNSTRMLPRCRGPPERPDNLCVGTAQPYQSSDAVTRRLIDNLPIPLDAI